MKIVKYRFPRLSLPNRPSTNQTHLPPPLKKKALLIGIQNTRQQVVEITQEDDERMAEEEVNDAVPIPPAKRKKKKKQKDKEGAPKAAKLKGPHRDVLQMKELLIGALYHDTSFSFCLRNGCPRRLPL